MDHSAKAFVVNTGIITAIGADTQACRDSLLGSISGITPIELLDTHWKNDFPCGEVKLDNETLAAMTGLNETYPRTALLSAVAVKEAWEPFIHLSEGLRTGFLSGNTVGGMDRTETVYGALMNKEFEEHSHKVLHHECGAVTEIVAEHFGITGFVTTISTACSSSANTIMMGAQMIENGLIDIAIAGGADALSRFTLNGFNTLMILDREPCQPFDQNRRGLNLGEGAGYVVLMSEKAMKQCGAKPICIVNGYANTNDAFHQTASSPDGAGNRMAMENALTKAGLTSGDIDYINLHGTGTGNNDSSEGAAVSAIFKDHTPYISSTKGFTGHTLGAAGGVEAVFSVLSIAEGLVFPNLRWATQMEDLHWKPVTEPVKGAAINNVLSNSFGFGGNCSSLVFSKCQDGFVH